MPEMLPVTAEAALTTLLVLMRRSYPQYMQFAHPFSRRNHEETLAVFADIVADQTLIADRAIEMLDDMGHVAPSVEFPMEYTDSHDLAIAYQVDRAIAYQKVDLATLVELSASLSKHASIRSLVDEAKGMAVAHIESLEECCQSLN